MNDEYTLQYYRTTWPDCVNIVIMLRSEKEERTVGIIEVRVYKGESENTGEALLWNLCIEAEHRRKGQGRMLMEAAEKEAKLEGAKVATLEWSKRESFFWVFDWYTRMGYDEKEFGNYSALMKKKL